MKKIVSIILVTCILASFGGAYAGNIPASTGIDKVTANTSSVDSAYTTDWRYWSAGASKYSEVRNSGCRIVAQSKLLIEAGVITATVDGFNPDIYYEWGWENGIWGKGKKLNASVLESAVRGAATGGGMIEYAEEKGIAITYNKFQVSGKSAEEKNAIVMGYLRAGYYVIVGGVGHMAYIGREASLASGIPIVWDSFIGSSYNSAIKREGLASAMTSFAVDNVYYYSVSTTKTSTIPAPPSPAKTAPIVTTSNVVSGITETNAVLYGSVSKQSGQNITRCGYQLGTSMSNMPEVVSFPCGSGTNSFQNGKGFNITCEMNREAEAEYRTLLPGTTYFYRCYAYYNGKPIYGEIRSFTTRGTAIQKNVTSISIDIGGVCIDKGSTIKLTARVLPSDATNAAVTWSSSNTSVATVDNNGTVTGRSAGNVIISATAGGKTATCDIEVIASTVTFSGLGVKNITGTSAEPYCTVSYTGTRPSEVGLSLGMSRDSLFGYNSVSINHVRNPFAYSYNVTKDDFVVMVPNTVYYYQFYAIVDGEYIYSNLESFNSGQDQRESTARFLNVGAGNITDSNAEPFCSISYTGPRPSRVGLYLGTSTSSMQQIISNAVNDDANPILLSYDLNSMGNRQAKPT
jgi:Bacterial surface proteins containing Ig-like domains